MAPASSMCALVWCLVLFWELRSSSTVAAANTRPHIIFILADDYGWNDVGFHGSNQIPTPNIDALAYSGVILHNYYVLPVCTPSRAALMTGRHPIHNGMQHEVLYAQCPWGLPLSEKLLPEYLKEMNYSTRMVGKWHLGHFKAVYTPTYRGFDSHYGYWVGHQDYYDHTSQENPLYWGYDMRHGVNNVSWSSYGRYTTDLFSEEAVRIIQDHDDSQPLFLYLAHLATHSGNPYMPLQAPAEVVHQFDYINDTRRRTFAGMVSKLDESVGMVVSALKEKGMLDNSVIVFSTDNGGPTNGFDNNVASNWPLRGVKDTIWEGAIRGVGLVWSPLIPGPSRVANHLMHIQDWLPTLLGAANYTGDSLTGLDGQNMWPTITQNETQPYDDLLLQIDNIRQFAALRSGDWKLIKGNTYNGNQDGWYGPTGRDPQYEYNLTLVTSSPVSVALQDTVRPLPSDISTLLELRAQTTLTCVNLTTLKEPLCDEEQCGSTHSPNSVYYSYHQGQSLTEDVSRGVGDSVPCNGTSGVPCLYNVVDDPCEVINLADLYPEKVEELLVLLRQYNETYVQPVNTGADPTSNPKYWNYTWTNWKDYPEPVLSEIN
uniref:Sulfatase N-terminal domain-containing protein n=1 Tax=Timema bartmani TaxID=61472 RepID=A0A7R9HXD8_9NEOP|nr:unnamed protein product [Timema bartmani]